MGIFIGIINVLILHFFMYRPLYKKLDLLSDLYFMQSKRNSDLELEVVMLKKQIEKLSCTENK